jgi:hypothetical protein
MATDATGQTTKQDAVPYLFPGSPSEYLFVRHDPTASITALLVKFSEAMSSRPRNCRSFSFSMIEATSGSSSDRARSGKGAFFSTAKSPTLVKAAERSAFNEIIQTRSMRIPVVAISLINPFDLVYTINKRTLLKSMMPRPPFDN